MRPLNEQGSFKTDEKHCSRIEKVTFVHDTHDNLYIPWIRQECYTYKIGNEKSKNKNKKIVILHLKNIK